jgi:flavin-binding protein dodecin
LLFTYGQKSAVAIGASSSRALFSIRVSPSVDNGISAAFGARELINRMQLTLRALDVSAIPASGNANLLVEAFLNSTPVGSATTWTNAVGNATNRANSSLAQIADYAGITTTTVTGGEVTAGFFVGSGANSIDLSQVRDLGNSILGGGGATSVTNIYPDGPDTLTIVVTNLTAQSCNVFGRLSWTEAQA